MKHKQTVVGEPCRRCGIPCSKKTIDVPCFEEGDTFETWKARQPAELFKKLFMPPVEEANDIDSAKAAVSQILLNLLAKLGPHSTVVDVVVSKLSDLVVAHIQEAKRLSDVRVE